jgi:hypothetical protein
VGVMTGGRAGRLVMAEVGGRVEAGGIIWGTATLFAGCSSTCSSRVRLQGLAS